MYLPPHVYNSYVSTKRKCINQEKNTIYKIIKLSELQKYLIKYVKISVMLIFDGTVRRTQGFTLAEQVLYYLTHISSLQRLINYNYKILLRKINATSINADRCCSGVQSLLFRC
jgi:hypothetical protein